MNAIKRILPRIRFGVLILMIAAIVGLFYGLRQNDRGLPGREWGPRTDIEAAIPYVLAALGICGPLILALQWKTQTLTDRLSFGEWLWIVQPSAWVALFVIASAVPPLAFGILFLYVLFQMLLFMVSLGYLLFIASVRRTETPRWSTYAGSAISFAISTWVLYELSVRPVII